MCEVQLESSFVTHLIGCLVFNPKRNSSHMSLQKPNNWVVLPTVITNFPQCNQDWFTFFSYEIIRHVNLFSESFPHINPLNTKRRLLYLKTQFVPRSKHFSSRL
jgi:hypothetical protein